MTAKDQSPRTPSLLYNRLSFAGLFLALVGFVTILLIFLLALVLTDPPAYLSVVLIPFFVLFVIGLVLALVGVGVTRRARARGVPPMGSVIAIDLEKPRHRWILLALLVGGVGIFAAVVTGSVETFEHMETNDFCGQTCHTVMTPEFTTYKYSSHARVNCVECHIGSGAEWFVRSKLSGLKQVSAVAFNTFPRPIPTPIDHLRPARETCEQCHWPNKFIGFKEILRSYYRGDEENTPYHLRMLMKIGGEGTSLMKGSGIHYHMLLANKVQYIARDRQRQDIAWVRVKDTGNGRMKIFQDAEKPLTEEQQKNLEIRSMDCMDCHNRPSHRFDSPMHVVNQALEGGAIDRSIPYIKVRAVKALDKDYPTTGAAMTGTEKDLRDYYLKEYPDFAGKHPVELRKAIEEVKGIYRRSIFPEMKAKWSAYPDNIGHRDWPGCFRCHNERMESEDGERIFTACNKCHLILAQGAEIDTVKVNFAEGLPFVHPDDDEEVSEYLDCTECHTGGAAVYD